MDGNLPPGMAMDEDGRTMIILAHRGNLRGPDSTRENSPECITEAIAKGYGIETDVRYAPDFGFYISHDPASPRQDNALATHAGLWRRNPGAIVALNIKETGSEAQLIECLRSLDVARQVFLFDMELVEPVPGEMAARFRSLDHAITIAARVSDRNEPPSRAIGNRAADTIWLDEFDGPWATRDTVAELIQEGRKVYAVSPELHGMKLEQAIKRWHDFALWGVTGICTDWPLLLARELESIDGRGISTGRNNGSQTP